MYHLHKILNEEMINIDNKFGYFKWRFKSLKPLQTKSMAAAGLCAWVINIMKFYEVCSAGHIIYGIFDKFNHMYYFFITIIEVFRSLKVTFKLNVKLFFERCFVKWSPNDWLWRKPQSSLPMPSRSLPFPEPRSPCCKKPF